MAYAKSIHVRLLYLSCNGAERGRWCMYKCICVAIYRSRHITYCCVDDCAWCLCMCSVLMICSSTSTTKKAIFALEQTVVRYMNAKNQTNNNMYYNKVYNWEIRKEKKRRERTKKKKKKRWKNEIIDVLCKTDYMLYNYTIYMYKYLLHILHILEYIVIVHEWKEAK